MGDSTGAALALGVVSATAHYVPGIPRLKLNEPLKGTLLISPWTCFKTDTTSWKENIDEDIFTREFHDTLVGDFIPMDRAPGQDAFSQPFETEPEWWKDAQVGSILNLAGTPYFPAGKDDRTGWAEHRNG